MRHLGFTFSTDTQPFNKGLVADTPVFQPLLPCFPRHVRDALLHFISCTFFHHLGSLLAKLPIVTKPCYLKNPVHQLEEVFVAPYIFGRVFAFHNVTFTDIAKIIIKQPRQALSSLKACSCLPVSHPDKPTLWIYLYLCTCTWLFFDVVP